MITARDIQRLLIGDRYRQSFILPNYTPDGWFENDVFEITKAGYWVEYEVKISRADFFQDAKKYARVRNRGRWLNPSLPPVRSKHDRMLAPDANTPCRFWFVAPAGLIALAEIPPWAGLIEIHSWGSRGREQVAKAAPQLHPHKPPDKFEKHARSVIYYRFNQLFIRHHQPTKKP